VAFGSNAILSELTGVSHSFNNALLVFAFRVIVQFPRNPALNAG
jgi:hypothetical protein